MDVRSKAADTAAGMVCGIAASVGIVWTALIAWARFGPAYGVGLGVVVLGWMGWTAVRRDDRLITAMLVTTAVVLPPLVAFVAWVGYVLAHAHFG